jgi:hypothetical protein
VSELETSIDTYKEHSVDIRDAYFELYLGGIRIFEILGQQLADVLPENALIGY